MTKIAFFSTSSRPIKALNSLAEKFEICLIVTKTDKFIGRDKNKTENEIKKFAVKNRIPLFEIDKLDSDTKLKLENTLSEIKPDIGITFDFGFIVPKSWFDIPKYKFVNIHFSLLPKYRGASAVQFAILSDEKEYGITYHLIDAKLDTGDILYQSYFNLNEEFNSEQAYKYLFDQSSNEINIVIENYINGNLKPVPQNHNEATYTYSTTFPKQTFIFKEDAFIKDVLNERKLFRQVKAYNPWPKPQIQTSLLLELTQFRNYQLKNKSMDPILKINDATFKNNHIEISEVTVVNGKSLIISDFISGYLKKK
jgi:methionyl-tRNA formyltransferase